MNFSYYFLMMLSGNSRIFYIINYKTEAYNSSLICLNTNKGGTGNSIPSLSDIESHIFIHVFANSCFCLCSSNACLSQGPTLYFKALTTVLLAMRSLEDA